MLEGIQESLLNIDKTAAMLKRLVASEYISSSNQSVNATWGKFELRPVTHHKVHSQTEQTQA